MLEGPNYTLETLSWLKPGTLLRIQPDLFGTWPKSVHLFTKELIPSIALGKTLYGNDQVLLYKDDLLLFMNVYRINIPEMFFDYKYGWAFEFLHKSKMIYDVFSYVPKDSPKFEGSFFLTYEVVNSDK